MSEKTTKVKRVRKSDKKTAVETKPVVEEKAVAETKPVEKKVVAEKSDSAEKKSSRQQISKIIGINLSVSRVRKHVDKNNVNADVEAACVELKSFAEQEKNGQKVNMKELSPETLALVDKAYERIYGARKTKHDALKARLTASNTPGDAKRLKELVAFSEKKDTWEEKVDYVSKLRCRFSNEASVVLSSGLDYVVQDIVRSAMVRARSLGKAIIQVCHVVHEDFSSLSVYPLVHKLDVVQKALHSGTVTEDQEDDEKVEAVDVDDDDDKNGTTFEFYVNLICKNVKTKLVESDESYAQTRISKHIRKFCSDVVIQLIERLSPLVKLYAQTAKVKTVTDDVVKFIFTFLLLDANRDNKGLCTYMDERLKTFRESKVSV